MLSSLRSKHVPSAVEARLPLATMTFFRSPDASGKRHAGDRLDTFLKDRTKEFPAALHGLGGGGDVSRMHDGERMYRKIRPVVCIAGLLTSSFVPMTGVPHNAHAQ